MAAFGLRPRRFGSAFAGTDTGAGAVILERRDAMDETSLFERKLDEPRQVETWADEQFVAPKRDSKDLEKDGAVRAYGR